MTKYFKNAWSCTISLLGGWSLVCSALAIPVVGLALHYWQAGEAAMSAELSIWLVYGIAATGLVFIAIFMWNLACAPFRLEKQRADEAEKHVNALETETAMPNAFVRSLSDSQSQAGALNETMTHLARLFEQYERLLKQTLVSSKFRGTDLEGSDLALVAKFLADEVKGLLPQLEFRPRENLVFQSGWNRYRVIFSVMMHRTPDIEFVDIPKDVEAKIIRVSRLDAEVEFFDIASSNKKQLPCFAMTLSAEL